jgi:hypothetical protein
MPGMVLHSSARDKDGDQAQASKSAGKMPAAPQAEWLCYNSAVILPWTFSNAAFAA